MLLASCQKFCTKKVIKLRKFLLAKLPEELVFLIYKPKLLAIVMWKEAKILARDFWESILFFISKIQKKLKL